MLGECKHVQRLLTLFTFSAMALILFVGCSRGSEDSHEESPTAQDIIESAASKWNETESVRFELDVDGVAYLDNDKTIRLQEAEGDAARPDAVEASAKIGAGFLTVDIGLIFLGPDAYMTDILSGAWGPAPADFSYNPAILFSSENGLGPVLRELQEPEVVGEEATNGTNAYHLRGTVEAGVIDAITAGTISGDPINVDLWFATEDYRALRIVLATPDDADGEPTIWTIDLFDHDQDVEIERPAS